MCLLLHYATIGTFIKKDIIYPGENEDDYEKRFLTDCAPKQVEHFVYKVRRRLLDLHPEAPIHAFRTPMDDCPCLQR